jgi:hypothetical protein
MASAANLRAIALAALAQTVPPASDASAEPLELGFLREHATDPPTPWQQALSAYRNQPAAADVALLELATALGLSDVELMTVVLAAAVEDDLILGRAIARLQSPLGGSRPTIGLLLNVLHGNDPPGIAALTAGAAVRSGLLLILNDAAPLPERPVSVPPHICAALSGLDGLAPGTTIGLGEVPNVPLGASARDLGAHHARALGEGDGTGRVLVIRCGSEAEGRSVAVSVAGALGRRAVFIDSDRTASLSPWIVLRKLVPVFHFELAPGDRKLLTPLPGYTGPVLVVCGPDGAVETASGAALSWTLTVPPRAERAALWREALGQRALAAELARDHRHGAGRIAHLGRLVRHRMATVGAKRATREDLAVVAWAGEGSGLDALAQALTDRVPDDALVAPAALQRALDQLLQRCRMRDALADGLGVSATTRYRPGVRALFVGASGTGKTLTAGWLATRLGIPLYRVDLASVTSKYIGETEKNLAQLLARAEHAEVVLLFDEADSLFGKRTDVREANDRFANQQTNYLLQRIESFEGITLLTSNGRARFDSAFSRRLDVVIEFPLPGSEERRGLWLSHLGTAHGLSKAEINQLAARVDFSGGHIRNAVFTASALAAAADRPIAYGDVIRGIEGEYLKLGKQVPMDLRVPKARAGAPVVPAAPAPAAPVHP